jgi:hypothetical protein
VKTGAVFLPVIGSLMVMAQLACIVLVPRIGPKSVVPVGMGLAANGLVWLLPRWAAGLFTPAW